MATTSAGVVFDQHWRNKPEGKMTIAEMATWARRLNDEELWQELEKSTGEWLDLNGAKKWNEPPRLSVILAREFDRQNSEAGVRKIVASTRRLHPKSGKGFSIGSGSITRTPCATSKLSPRRFKME
ncbi:MAG: hypothetical protein QNL33_08305 [Akkermansiaceae bacterium]